MLIFIVQHNYILYSNSVSIWSIIYLLYVIIIMYYIMYEERKVDTLILLTP
jgi:hypothetical protein